jgi:hypothetical protein
MAPEKLQSKVAFSHVNIATFSVRPCGYSVSTDGPAFTMDKLLSTKGPLNLDLYEFARVPIRKKENELKMNGHARETFFKEIGYSRGEIKKALAEDGKNKGSTFSFSAIRR